MIIYIGFIMKQGELFAEFATDDIEVAKDKAKRLIDDALHRNTVEVFGLELNPEEEQPIMVASWTQEGEILTLIPKP